MGGGTHLVYMHVSVFSLLNVIHAPGPLPPCAKISKGSTEAACIRVYTVLGDGFVGSTWWLSCRPGLHGGSSESAARIRNNFVDSLCDLYGDSVSSPYRLRMIYIHLHAVYLVPL